MEHESINAEKQLADKQLNELVLDEAIAAKNESLSNANFIASISLLITGGVAFLTGQALSGINEYSDPLTSASLSALIATGGCLVGSVCSTIQNDRATSRLIRGQR